MTATKAQLKEIQELKLAKGLSDSFVSDMIDCLDNKVIKYSVSDAYSYAVFTRDEREADKREGLDDEDDEERELRLESMQRDSIDRGY